MGPRATKIITGTRLGADGIRAPSEKLSRIRSGIFKFGLGLISPVETEKYVKGLVAQLRFLHQLCPKDAVQYARKLRSAVKGRFLSAPDKKFLPPRVARSSPVLLKWDVQPGAPGSRPDFGR